MNAPVCAPRIRGRVLGLAALALLVSAPQAGAQEPTSQAPTLEAGLFEIRIARLAARTVIVQVDANGRVLLPVDAVLDLAGMPFERPHPDSARSVPLVGRTGSDATRATLDLRTRTIALPGQVDTLAVGAAAVVDGDLYLESGRIAHLLQAEVHVDFSALTATLSRVPPFPVEQQALAAERRAAAARRPVRRATAGLRDAPYSRETGGMVLDWNVSTAPYRPHENSSVQGQLGAAVYGGSLTLGGNWFTAGPGVDNATGNWNYTYNRPRSAWLRQVQLGDLLGGGVQLRTLRGVSLTNARLIRDGLFAEVPVQPEVPSGWSYEVYQDGQLLGFAEAGASESIVIPLRYGTTPVRVRMLGPAGEEVLSDFRYQIHSSQLAPGLVEYSAGVGACREESCGVASFARADWGATSRLTLGASAEWAGLDSARRLDGAFRALALLARDWSATLDVVPTGRSQLLVSHDTYAGQNSSIAMGVIEPGGTVSSVGGLRSRWFGDARHSRAVARDGARIRGVRIDFHLEGPKGSHADRLFSTLTLDGPRGAYAVRYERDPSLNAALVQLSHFTVLRRDAKGRFAYLPLTGSVAASRQRVERVEAGTSLRTGRRGSVNMVARWTAGSGGMLSINYDALLGRARVSSRGVTSSRGGTSLVAAAGGAAALSRGAGPVFVDQAGSNLAGVAGRVFYDADGNGVYSVGDEPAAGLGVVAGNQRVTTDEQGRYSAWSLMPYEVTSVAVDTVRDIDASYVPLRGEVMLRATPNLFNSADFPLVRTRELAGRLVAGAGIDVVGGVTIELKNVATGETQRTMTFSDGEFYVSRLRPGRYELRVAASSLAALRAVTPEAVVLEVTAGGAGLPAEVPPIEIRRELPPTGSR